MRISDWSSDVCSSDLAANAESQYVDGSGSASADLDFQIIIPRILFLRVGTGTDFADNGAIDLISFNVPGASLGNGTAVAATATSGDLGNGAVTARVLGNGGNVTLTSTTLGALSNGAGSTISYSQIETAVTALGGVPGAAMPHPTLADTGTGSVALASTAGIVDRGATWRSEEHTSELQSLMRISYAVFCLKKKKHNQTTNTTS